MTSHRMLAQDRQLDVDVVSSDDDVRQASLNNDHEGVETSKNARKSPPRPCNPQTDRDLKEFCATSKTDSAENLVEAWSINDSFSVNDNGEEEDKDVTIIVQDTEMFGTKISTLVFPSTLEQAAAEKDPEVIHVPPLQTIPFVSIDLKVTDASEVSHTDLYSDSDDDSSIIAEFIIPSLRRSHDWDQGKLVASCKHEGEPRFEDSIMHSNNQQSGTSLDVEGLVPLCNEDIESSDCSTDSMINENAGMHGPQHSFLFEYLASHCKEKNNAHSLNNEHSTAILSSQQSLSTTQQEGSSLPSRKTYASLLERLSSSGDLNQHFLKKMVGHTTPYSTHEESARATTDSNPYLVQQQPQKGITNHASSVHSNRCHIPFEIQVVHRMTSDTCLESPRSNKKGHSSHDVDPFDFDLVLDPAESLICGKLENAYLKHISDSFQKLLLKHYDPGGRRLEWMKSHPMVCQIRYDAPSHFPNSRPCFPLHFFCAMGCVEECKLAYHFFPEAIGMSASPLVGFPLHYACRSPKANVEIIQFLLERFVDASRITQESHQTPLHMACQSPSCELESIQLLIDAYPTAAQLADSEGYTPLHYACQHRMPLRILQALHSSGPAAIGAAAKSWHKPLHIAALSGCNVKVLEWLIETDRRSIKCTLDDFSTTIHCVLIGIKKFPNEEDSILKLRTVIQAFPGALRWENDKDQTPLDLAQSLNLPRTVLQILAAPVS